MPDTEAELAEAVRSLRGAFRDGVSPDLVNRVYGLLGMYLPFQPIAVWEEWIDGDFGCDNDHFVVVGTVTYEMPVQLWDYLTRGEGPDPSEWDFRPHRVAKARTEVVPEDPTGINRLRWRPSR